jgi:hypothetical protein
LCRPYLVVDRIASKLFGLALLIAPAASMAEGVAGADRNSGERALGGREADLEETTIALPGGAHVVIAPRTQAYMAPQVQRLALWPGKLVPTHSVFLRSGRVDVDIPEASVGQSAVVVAAPDETRVLIGSGKSSVRISRGRLFAACESGSVKVSEGVRYRTVPAGKLREVTRARSSDHDLLPGPSLRGPELHIVTRGEAPLGGYGWDAVPGATSYVGEIRDTQSAKSVIRFATPTTRLPVGSNGLPPGRYELAVRAVDQYGMEGKAAPAQPIRVVGVELPVGAVVPADDRIELDLGQSIRLTSAEGLHVAVARGPAGLTPTDPIKLSKDRPIQVFVRTSPRNSPQCLTLVPRQAPIAVEVGPKDAIWPVDFLNLEVRITGSAKAAFDVNAAPPARAFLGVEPIDVAWRRSANGWRARLGPQPGRGPWVVRLEAYNQHGAVVARDSVEVIRMPGSRVIGQSRPGPTRPSLSSIP